MSEFIEISRPIDRVLLVTLNRPQKLNALSVAVVSELAAVMRDAQDNDDIGSVVLTGRGRAFSAGADIADQQKYGEDVTFSPTRLRDWTAIANFEKPWVAAVSGYALGGGNELAMMADIIIAADDALFGQPEIKIGIFPGDGGTQRLIRAVGKSRAMQMILTGEPIDAATAIRAGLISELVAKDRLNERALEIAASIARHAPVALRAAKKAVLHSYEAGLSAGLAFERETLREPFNSPERKQRMAAFLGRKGGSTPSE
jgi:enoyl-CoA hydratase/carnithine racemase